MHPDSTITVDQAYPQRSAEAALRAGTFVAPFKRERLTWIKPSFLGMMYRCGWASKPDQERVLRIEIDRTGFERAPAHAALSHFRPGVHADHDQWRAQVAASPVRVQWDPDRSVPLEPQPWRAVQVGLSGETVDRYVDDWIVDLTDVTELARSTHSAVLDGRIEEAGRPPPAERPYPLPEAIRRRLGADG
ncbi:DUF4291 domain-containing protein [Streptomyces thermoviolaceus]|uniref:DUF4291 domain-containing protein n=1 Tax=Streptomyces thermoviolaceus TaxID=1952 RepID=UPI00167B6FBD|nr:DUF4291 domain-containing protein [Streptomyces thermoviolaceus]WTD49260.1 DUF4291 domain-containing protein [Streptomyces thermoviolaceus]GGV60068.1 hypothetical protein GCM10010499_00310 [Streptomyces thermoviolaceus subsp. apingens]